MTTSPHHPLTDLHPSVSGEVTWISVGGGLGKEGGMGGENNQNSADRCLTLSKNKMKNL